LHRPYGVVLADLRRDKSEIMKTGQRINLIKKLATRLGEHGYGDGDLTLRQFGLPWTDSWTGSGGPVDYFLAMVEHGDVGHLSAMHAYLFPGDPLPGLAATPAGGRWQEGTLRLFLSHSSTKKLLVAQIKQELLEFGIESFVAHEDIEPSREWLDEIRLALNTCHAFAAILCQEFKKSNYCDQEVGYALQRGLLVIPVRLEIDPYGFMAPLQGVPAFNKKPSEIAADIRKLLLTHPTTKPIIGVAEEKRIEHLVNDFLCSTDFGTSTKLLKNLEAYDVLPKKLIEKIAANWEKNDQIVGCLGIPRRMGYFLKHHAMKEYSEKIRK
jgi:hypothetical protein